MKGRKGFTLIELMVVIFIVGILAAVAIPIMRGRIDSAKWSEGRAAAGSIRTAARAFCAEKGPTYTYDGSVDLTMLGFGATDLEGKYFSQNCYTIAWLGYDDYLITVNAAASTKAEAPATPANTTLDEAGDWGTTAAP